MLVKSIQVSAYRNLERQRIELADGINLLVGDNGHGKTNLLEAIHVLATLRSFRSASTRDLIQHGQDQSRVDGLVVSGEIPVELRIVLTQQGRRLWIGGNPAKGLKEYLGQLRVVAFTPDDLGMVKGGPSTRRRFLDRAVFLFEPDHLRRVREYNAALKARNRLLKGTGKPDADVLDSFSQTMARTGAAISCARRALIERIGQRAREVLAGIEAGPDRLTLRFRAGWRMDKEGGQQPLLAQLRSCVEEDCRRGQTGCGPQQDDFDVLLDDVAARKFASQGQQRACSLSLLLAVVREVVAEGHEKPVILLDDVSSELDQERREHLFDQIVDVGGQVLVTTTDAGLVEGLVAKASRRFAVQSGRVRPDEAGGA